MNRPDLYNKTVNILFDAYFNDTLEHGNCYACAIGNIIAANRAYKLLQCETIFDLKLYWEGFLPYHEITNIHSVRFPKWFMLVRRSSNYRVEDIAVAEKQIADTGYNLEEVRKIENAFEDCDMGSSEEDYMFNGLVAVLETLKKIHEVEDNEEEVQRFREHYSLKTSKI